jgi:hypothetical protein
MLKEQLRILRWTITILYLTSFVLPIGGFWGLGALYFIAAPTTLIYAPGLTLIWAANPLLWVGFYYLRLERWDRVSILGTIACLLAYLVIVPFDGCALVGPPNPPALALLGYYAWIATMALLAGTGLSGWATKGFSEWPRLRNWALMIVIALIALLLVLSPILPWFMRTSGLFRLRGVGFYMG